LKSWIRPCLIRFLRNIKKKTLIFFTIFIQVLVDRTLSEPYVAPFFFFFFKMMTPLFLTSTFFHINNIFQLSMYHCMTYIQ
jgi:hypothetical protein